MKRSGFIVPAFTTLVFWCWFSTAKAQDTTAPTMTSAFSRYDDAITMRTDRFRYTRYEREYYAGDRNHLPSTGSRELFDHQADPGENRNVAADPAYTKLLTEAERQFDAGGQGTFAPG